MAHEQDAHCAIVEHLLHRGADASSNYPGTRAAARRSMAAPKIHVVRDEPAAAAVERYQHGWRSGKPVEDPDKLKRWGWIGAKPSEFLVVTRRGEIDRKR